MRRHPTETPKVVRRETDIEIHAEEILRAILDTVLNLEGGLQVLQLKTRQTGVAELNSSGLTLTDQSEAHLSRHLSFIHFLQSLCRDSQGYRTRGSTCGDEPCGHGLAQACAVDVGHRLGIRIQGRHATRSRDKWFRSRQEHWWDPILPFLEVPHRTRAERWVGAPEVAGLTRTLFGKRQDLQSRRGTAAASHRISRFNCLGVY